MKPQFFTLYKLPTIRLRVALIESCAEKIIADEEEKDVTRTETTPRLSAIASGNTRFLRLPGGRD
jgi:hypothetical protein